MSKNKPFQLCSTSDVNDYDIENIDEIAVLLSMFSETIHDFTNETIKLCNDQVSAILTEMLSRIAEEISDLTSQSLNAMTPALEELLNAFSSLEASNSGYIEMSPETFDRIEENIIEIPRDLYIKTTSKTIRIKSDFLIALISLVLSVLIPMIQNHIENQEANEIATQELQLLREQNETLSEILQQITTSDEETAEILRSLQQSVDTANSLTEETLKVLDSPEESPDNMIESGCNQSNTESGKNCK